MAVVIFALAAPVALAQAAPPPPSAPYFKNPPSGTSWTIDIRHEQPRPKKKAPGAGPDGAPVEATGGGSTATAASDEKFLPATLPVRMEGKIGQNKIRHEITYFSDNRKEEAFSLKGQMMRRFDGDTKKIAVITASPPWPGIDWVHGGAVYVGTEMVNGKECYKFRISDEYLQSLNWPSDSIYLAWISVADRYPVRAQNDEVTYTFSDISPFTKNVNLPEEYRLAYEGMAQTTRALDMMRKANEPTESARK
ncbi:hypothetical protein DB346_03355 [Verrucomicrobia bacterium LW23]|nr:hypothetical protein DB346_03355 [Verrucomicrobia bacterium LW23]